MKLSRRRRSQRPWAEAFEDRLGRRLFEMNTTLVSTRADARESLALLRRLESKVDCVANAVLGGDQCTQEGVNSAGLRPLLSSPQMQPRQDKAAGGLASPSSLFQARNTSSSMGAVAPANIAAGGELVEPVDDFKGKSGGPRMSEMEIRMKSLELQIARIIEAMGIKERVNVGDDNEDRKRLKEKLNEALENDRRNRLHTIVSEREVWLEYLFGICSPDRRNGKRGNRYAG
jgi:hypothetical protein